MRYISPLPILIAAAAFSAEEAQTKRWSAHIELSYVNTSGNTNTQTLSEKLEIKWEGEANRFFLKNSALYATQEDKETANRIDVSGRWERLITERFFGFLTTGYERDKFSGYTYKWNGGPGVGYDLLKTERHELKTLLSVLYYYNRIEDDGIDNYTTFKAEVYYRWSILENLKLKEDINYIANLSDTKTYFVNSDASLEVKVNEHISLGVGYKVAYQNKPPSPDVKRTDTTFSTSLIVDF
ncbi:Putative salt-induced outer membrane protein-like protein [Hydrogenivirga sp. 128-5-R1-1]|nr:Putative salt-induced outer membrane protein-like protein [Hydrogenivirga sp. 128-5-R1-1]